LFVVKSAALLVLVPVLGLAQTKGDPKAGKAKYDTLCVGCHGSSGKGDGLAAATLNPKPQDHTNGKYMNTLTDQYLFDMIKAGGPSVKKSPLMQPYMFSVDSGASPSIFLGATRPHYGVHIIGLSYRSSFRAEVEVPGGSAAYRLITDSGLDGCRETANMKPWMGEVDTGSNVRRSIFLGDSVRKPYTAL
jgi:cytochrome c553